jgi:2-methylcitrate dehydratase PrpD
MTTRLLLYDRPSTALEAKFSMPFCAAAAVLFGKPSLETFEDSCIRDARIQSLLPAVALRANPAFDTATPLSQATVTVKLKDGRTLVEHADGARGYPGRLSGEELAAKFIACARRVLSEEAAAKALVAVQKIESFSDIAELADALGD